MKYQASLPQRNDNVSEEHPLKDFVYILSVLALASIVVFVLLGYAVDWAVDKLSPQAEATLNRMMASSVSAMPVEASPSQVRVAALVAGMQHCAGVNGSPAVSLYKSDAPNAVVFPGARMVVFTGLLTRVKSENGLAFVLAHELAHVANRDHLRAMGRGIVLFGISAVLTGSDSGVTDLLAPATHLGHAKYSRERESLADARALDILNCRYGHAGGATELFLALKGEDAGSSNFAHYVGSHPSMQARIAALEKRIVEKHLSVGATIPLLLNNSK